MNSTTTEKYNLEAEALQEKRLLAFDLMQKDLERWYKAELGNESVSMDDIIADDVMYQRNANLVFKLMLTGYTDEALKLLSSMYDTAVSDTLYEAIDNHFGV